MSTALPPLVQVALTRAADAGFELSSEPAVGALLAALAAAVAPGGRILELGTGAGVGLAWLVSGLDGRSDVEIVTVDLDADLQRKVRGAPWPVPVRFEVGDGAEVVQRLGRFDLVFADAPGGKILKLQRTLDALAPGGILVVDDMDLLQHEDMELRSALAIVRERLLSNAELQCAELAFSSGVILAVKRR